MHGGIGQLLRLFLVRLPRWARAVIGAVLIVAGLLLRAPILAVLGALVCAQAVAEGFRRWRTRQRPAPPRETAEGRHRDGNFPSR